MITHTANYYRKFSSDLAAFQGKNPEWLEKFRSVSLAALPILTCYSPLRAPLFKGLGTIRALSYFSQFLERGKNHQSIEAIYHLFQGCLATSSVALAFFNPRMSGIVSSISDLIANSKECLQHLKKSEYKRFLESFAHLTLGVLYLGTICYGSIELTVAFMLLQTLVTAYSSVTHFTKGEILEGVLTALTTGIYIKRAIPQAKLLYWKQTVQPILEATLKQDSRGFVYLDIPNEYVKDLCLFFKQQGMELPPYFKPGMAGAHISIMLSGETKYLGPIAEVGQKFTFRIAELTTIEPVGFSGVNKVWFLTLACPGMEELRQRYGLAPRLNGDHDFHLTFAVEKN